jgi:hypothetical protein
MTKPNKKTANKRQLKTRVITPGASPRSNFVPPPEHRFQSGNKAAVGHGRPRKLRELQELIKDVMAEDIAPDTTRIKAAIRLGLRSKNPSVWLEYAFGKMPVSSHEMDGDEWREWLIENGYTPSDIESLADEFASFLRDRGVGELRSKETETNNDSEASND